MLVVLSNPSPQSVLPHLFLAMGMAVRVWAAGYIGPTARKNTFVGNYVITNGPYRLIKNPLYVGNFSLVIGVILLFTPPVWFATIIIIAFLIEYSIIVMSEQNYLTHLPRRKAQFHFGNLKNEISTVLVIIAIYFIYVIRLKV
jgi:protein-S-isoprenylcysteine O-methyltransferase Ste14